MDLAEENKRLKEEIEALKQAQKETVTVPTDTTPQKYHESDCLRSSDFSTPRTQAAKDAINHDVTHEFFSAHEKNTALNVQRDIKQSCKLADDRVDKLEDASRILEQAAGAVESSGDGAVEVIRKSFSRFNVELEGREEKFVKDLEMHRNGELAKIQKEKTVVEQLLTTLDLLIREARNVMTGPVSMGADGVEGCEYKTLAEIKNEFTQMRKVLLPWDSGYLFDMITAKASEQMIGLRTTAVHDIISGLIETLSTAREKASATFETLNSFISEVEVVVPETKEKVQDEFGVFKKMVAQKEEVFVSKVAHYKENYLGRIEVEQEFVDEWIGNLQSHQRSSREAVETGNDYQLLRNLENLNQALVHIDGSTLTLGFDKISFTPCESVLQRPLDQLGVLVREEINITPKFVQSYHYYQFLEHKEYMYGGCDEIELAMQGGVEADLPGITNKERKLFEASFDRVSKYKDGTMDQEELGTIWGEVFSGVPKQAITSITQKIFTEIDTAEKHRIHFEEFMGYISEGMRTNLGAQRDQFYRSSDG